MKDQIDKAKVIVLIVSGGIGRNICSTAVVRAIHKQYPDKELHVIASCPDIFLKNPYVKKIHRLGQQFSFFDDFILDKNSVILDVEPYRHYDYIYKNKHFTQCWCELLDINFDGITPEFYLSNSENKMAQLYLSKFDKKPLILIQPTGGKTPEKDTDEARLIAQSSMYRRNVSHETIQEVSDILNSKGYTVGIIQSENQVPIKGTEQISLPIKAIIALIPYVKGIIAIDSFLQHAAAAYNKRSLILWGGTSPKVLGYECHKNLTNEVCNIPFCHRPNSYLFDFGVNGFMWDCPNSDECMNYKSKRIIEEFEELIK